MADTTPRAEIEYVVPAGPDQDSTYEGILAAMGAYQEEIPFPAANEVKIDRAPDDTITIKLSREALRSNPDLQTPEALAKLEEEMREGVERHREYSL
jgi:hypothetical protein